MFMQSFVNLDGGQHDKCAVLGGASEEEEEIGGRAGGGEGRPVGDGHSGGQRAHLQHSEGSAALYPGECAT